MNREDFPIINDNLIYLDNAATTLKPNKVIDAINDYYKNYSDNIHRGEYDLSFKADQSYENARLTVANFINADEKSIVFTKGTTDSLNMIVDGYFKDHLNKDDEVLITKSEHASNVLPWFNLAKEKGIKVSFIELNDDLTLSLDNIKNAITDNTKVISLAGITNVIGDIKGIIVKSIPLENNKLTLDNVKKMVNKNTKVISVAMVTNVLGDVRPIKEICELAHSKGILVVEDGAQSVPHMKVDVKDSNVDFLAFSGHKLCGPTGIGVLYIKPSLVDEFKSVEFGGGMNESFDSVDEVYLKEAPIKYEAGTPHIAGAIGLASAIDYIESVGLDKIHEYECELKDYLVSKLSNIDHIKVINPNTKSGIVAITIDDIFPQDVGYYLNKYNICVRTGNHCDKLLKDLIGVRNTLRISLYFYNTKEEIDKLVELLSDKNKIISEMI